MGSALGKMGVMKFEPEAKTPQLAKVTIQYIGTMAAAIGGITGDEQLNQIGAALGGAVPPPEPVPTPPPGPHPTPTPRRTAA